MKLLSKNVIVGFLILMLLAGAYSLLQEGFKSRPALSLSDLVGKINAGEVAKISIAGDDLEVVLKDSSVLAAKKETESSLTQTLSNYGVSKEALDKVALEVNSPSGVAFWLSALLPFLLPFLLIVLFFWLAARQVQRANVQAFTFGQSRARVVQPDSKKERLTFRDVAGAKEAKEELVEIVDFLKSPKKFLEIGARIPKGVLLMGAPGTGKTLLARAVAGEAGVPFFHISGSEFVEMFVGVGASRVPDLCKNAQRAGAKTAGQLVGAITTGDSCGPNPSTSPRIRFKVGSRSSSPPPSPAPLWRPTASISSMNMMAGAARLAVLNKSRTRDAPTPTNISTNSEPEN